jgi:hypothetical protein
MKEIVDRKERATRRAATGRALARLIGRGLLQSCLRGAWRLTRAGVTTSRRIFPDQAAERLRVGGRGGILDGRTTDADQGPQTPGLEEEDDEHDDESNPRGSSGRDRSGDGELTIGGRASPANHRRDMGNAVFGFL